MISQSALDHFRTSLSSHVSDPYSVLLKRNKLPMSLLEHEGKGSEGKVSTSSSVFRAKLVVSSGGSVDAASRDQNLPLPYMRASTCSLMDTSSNADLRMLCSICVLSV